MSWQPTAWTTARPWVCPSADPVLPPLGGQVVRGPEAQVEAQVRPMGPFLLPAPLSTARPRGYPLDSA